MDKKTTLQRIKYFIDFKGVSIRAFEQNVGMSNGSFASQLKNNKTIGVDKLENILRIYSELNAEWLLTGKGEMLHSTNKHAINQSIIGSNNKMAGKNIGNDAEYKYLEEIKDLKKQIENKDNIINTLIKQQETLINKLANL
jgi:hypothetical protein